MAEQGTLVPGAQTLGDGEMKQFEVGGQKVLLAKVNGTLHAAAALCPHYSMPLAEGLLCGSMLRCAYHQSTFDITSGKLLEPPAMDGLAMYPVRVEGGRVFVTLPEPDAPTTVPPSMASATAADQRDFVILGAGAAGTTAAQALRENGFRGRITLITADRDDPYDRPNLSKDFLTGQIPADYLPLRPGDFYKQHDISLLHKRVVRIDTKSATLHFDDGSPLHYDKLLLATGAEPRRLDVPGANLKNVLVLRSRADCEQLIAAAQAAKRVVVIGSSFIGMEVAASLRERKLDVTVVAPSATPFERILGAEVGGFFQRLHERNGVSFRLRSHVERLEGNEKVTGVVLKDGERLPADLVVVGIGVRPATEVLPAEWRDEHGAVPVDATLRVISGGGNIFAAGDISRFPAGPGGQTTRIEHWRVAEQQGRTAAKNMVSPQPSTRFDAVPYFWSLQFGTGLDYVGHAENWDRVQIDGELDSGDFTAYYIRGNRIIAAASCNRSRQMSALLELMNRGQITAAQITMPNPDWPKELCSAAEN